MSSRLARCAVTVMLMLTAMGCGRCSRMANAAEPATTTTTPVRLTFGITAEPACLVPLFGGSAADAEVGGLLFRELVAHTADGPVADLAEYIPTLGHGVEVGDDGRLLVRWALKPGSTWSDGTAVTARDVVAGWKVATADDQAVTTGRELGRSVDAIDVTDDLHFTVVWKKPDGSFAAPRVHRVLPAHLVLDGDGHPKNLSQSGYLRRPVGNGPFVLIDDVAGAHLLFRKRTDATVAVDEVLVRILPSTESLTSALLAGDVDATFPQAGLSPTEAARLAADSPGFTVARAPGSTWVHLDFNLDDTVLKNVKVRRAIAYAMDRERLVSAIAGDAYDVDEGYLPRHHPARIPLARLPFDPDSAEVLLDDAGLKRPAEGAMRTLPDGTPWRLQLAAASGQRDTERLLALVQDSLRQVGVDVALDLRPFKVFFGEGAKKRKLPHLSFYAWTVDADSTGSSLWRADRIPTADNGYTGLNLPGWRNANVTARLIDADAAIDPAKRAFDLGVVQTEFMRDVPALSFYFRPAVVVARAGVTGLVPSGTATPLAFGAHGWRVAPASTTGG